MTATSFHVGIVGHRPPRLAGADPAALRRVLGELLRATADEVLRAAGPGEVLRLTAISPLAEGADRLFAGAAIEAGFALHCVMPFDQAEYERDFDGTRALEPDSLARFRALLAEAARTGCLTVTELAGDRRRADDAYRAAGVRVVELSDLLVAVWDGEQRGSMAGTDGAVAMARERGTPTVWVHAVAPHAWRLLDSVGDATQKDDDARWNALRCVVRRLLDA